ncbi:dipeptidase [Clostridiaceae bacterium M8S5]|nr:dipeptidase [Clostridiaceae bacterium M8S5]
MNKFPIVDAHYDILVDVTKKRAQGKTKVIEREYLNEFRESGVNIIVCSIFLDSIYVPEMALRQALNQINALYLEIEESPEDLMLCRSYDDITKALDNNKIGFLLSFEGVEPLGNDINLLKIFYELGVRLVGLVWSRRNYAGDGSSFTTDHRGTGSGLTEFGKELVKRAEKLGMIIDVSHLNDEGFWDVMKIAKNPVIASHSNCRELCKQMRNLRDEQIQSLASTGGVIGMNTCSKFVSNKEEDKNYKTLVNHIDYIVKLIGIEYVGFGFDFCDFLRENKKSEVFDVLDSYKELPLFVEELVNRGYSDEDIKKIVGDNFLNVFKKVLNK